MPLNQKIIRQRSKRKNASATILPKKKDIPLQDGSGKRSGVGESIKDHRGAKRDDSREEHQLDSDDLSSGDEIIHPNDDDYSYDRPEPLDDSDTDESSLSLGIPQPRTPKSAKRKQSKKKTGKSKARVSRSKTGQHDINSSSGSEQEKVGLQGGLHRRQGRKRQHHVDANQNDATFDSKADEETRESKTKDTKKRGKKRKSAEGKNNNEDEQSFNASESSDDDDFAPDKSSKSIKKRTTDARSKETKVGKIRGKIIHVNSSDDSQENVKPRRGAKQSKRQKSKARGSTLKTSTLSDLIADSDDDEDELSIKNADNEDARVVSIGFRRSSRRGGTQINLKEDSTSDVEEYLDNQLAEAIQSTSPEVLRRSKRKRQQPSSPVVSKVKRGNNDTSSRRQRAAAREEKVSDEDAEDVISATLSTGRSPRASATKAARKMADYLKDGEGEGEDEDEELLKTRSPKTAEDDDAFEIDDDSDSSDSDLDDEDGCSHAETGRLVGNVDADASFLDPDDSDDDDPERRSSRTPPSSTQKRGSRKATAPDSEQWEVESSDGQSDGEGDLNPSPALESPHMPFCQSTTDAITMEPLPKKHVCFYMPDGKTKQCFALETLHKIALSEPVMYADEKATFKQPPHFRTSMSADIEDQIASRFGRAAVDVRGPFYNPGKLEFDYTVNSEDLDLDEAFAERVNKYVNNCMGSRDVYCCPICYIEAHRRLENNEIEDSRDDDSSDDETENLNLEFVADPMTVVGCVDGDEFKLASAFCFGKIVQVKEHLRTDHAVLTSTLDGNDLFKRFQIRAADGLLQRFLDKKKNKNHKSHRISRQGEMVSYWFNGNNELFVFLLDLMDRWRIARQELEASTDVDDVDSVLHEFREFQKTLKRFWSSFSKRGVRIWEVVSEPYQKGTKQELEDFLEEGENAEDAGDAIQYHLINREIEAQPTPEEEIVSALRQSRGKATEDSSYSEENDEESEENFKEDDQLASSSDERARRYYSEESEVDEWEQLLKKKRKARLKNDRRRPNVKVVESQPAKKLGGVMKRTNERIPSVKAVASNSVAASANKRRRVIQESDSDNSS